jgi:hypothetical protein
VSVVTASRINSAAGLPLLGPIWSAWRSLTRQEVLSTAAVGLGVGLLMGLASLDYIAGDNPPSVLQLGFSFGLVPVAAALMSLLCWVVADRAPHEGMARYKRLASALVVAAVITAWMVPLAVEAIFGPSQMSDMLQQRLREDGKEPPRHFVALQSMLSGLIYGGMVFVLIEVRRRRRQTNEALTAIVYQRAAMSRRVFESRLAAMQAQVEPQFLFNTLVDIEALYERDAHGAARILDDLIAYLRVALPRLRESGASAGTRLAEEVDLVRAYLEVVSARHAGRPQVRFVVEPECAHARFYPMLLLPLVQRGVRGAAQDEPPPAERVEITAKRVHDDVVVALRVHAPGLCDEHPELLRVRERLDGLYGGRATLYCDEPKLGITDFTLRIPFETHPC